MAWHMTYYKGPTVVRTKTRRKKTAPNFYGIAEMAIKLGADLVLVQNDLTSEIKALLPRRGGTFILTEPGAKTPRESRRVSC